MSEYKTKQRKVLLDFLKCHTDQLLSAEQIASGVEESNMSLSAVYRNLSKLEEEGKVRRESKNNTRSVLYQFTDDEECKHSLHLSCKKCGKTFHMKSEITDMVINNIAENERFSVDKEDTVLYGICKKCCRER